MQKKFVEKGKIGEMKLRRVKQFVGGGLTLWWRKEIDVIIYYKWQDMINTTINMNKGDGPVHITWIYGSTQWRERLRLWDELLNIAQTRNDPWVCLGSFNEIALISEKEGGQPKPPRMLEAFN